MLKFNVQDQVRLVQRDETTGWDLPPVGTEGEVTSIWNEGYRPEPVPYPYWVVFENDPEGDPHLVAEEEIEHV